VDYLVYIFAILVVGLLTIAAVRLATRSKNPDLLLQYEARKKASRQLARDHSSGKSKRKANIPAVDANGNSVMAVKSLRQRHYDKHPHNRTPWGWPGASKDPSAPQGISQAVRNFTDRMMREKQLVQPKGNTSNGSIRALLEDRYAPVDRGMTEIPYQKVKRPLLRDPSEQHDQLDNLGGAEARQLRKKLQLLAAMDTANTVNGAADGKASGSGNSKKPEFRYVELKDIKQPWGW
jgi:hypothetical protein